MDPLQIIPIIKNVIDMMEKGFHLVAQLKEHEIKFHFIVKNALLTSTGKALLAFAEITNLDEKPHSISDIYLKIGDQKIFRAPIKEISAITSGSEAIKVITIRNVYKFINPTFDYFEILPLNIYLQPNESIIGCLVFEFPNLVNLSDIIFGLKIAGRDIIFEHRLL